MYSTGTSHSILTIRQTLRGSCCLEGTRLRQSSTWARLWDGMAFSGLIIDRRPALTGGPALLYSIPVSVSGSRITLTVPAALAAQVRAAVVLPGASWNCLTVRADGPMGTLGVHSADTIGRQPWPQ